MGGIGASVTAAFDHAWDRFRGRLAGLGDDEYRWEPAPGCWSVRPDGEGRWRIDGNGGDGGPAGAPDPPPLTTIAWRIGHIGLSFVGFGDRLFSDGRLTVDDVAFAGSAAAALDWLDDTYSRCWRDGIGGLDDARWAQPIGPAFGPYAEQSTADLALHVLDELVHHGAEVGLLRDLYLRRDALRG